MKGWGIRSLVIPIPFMQPQMIPTTIGTTITTNQGNPALETMAKDIKDNIRIEPTERSIPAVTITMNIPRAKVACQAVCLKTLVKLRQVKKTSGCKMCRIIIISAMMSKIP